MDIFKIHSRIIDDYQSYITSFVNIKDEVIRQVVEAELEKGKLWPEPLIQFNPSFEVFGDINGVVSRALLHPDFKQIFTGYKLYRHQVEAIRLGTSGKDFVVTSGTGSGKSLAYIGTIFHHLLTRGKTTGIKAIIVYPMNALINSQSDEFDKYKENYVKQTGREFPITYGQYTGQEDETRREELRSNPPDILLTNYMMLELILTRIKERPLRDSIYECLKFLVFDELHTFRGRQGSDVALLVRRIKAQCASEIITIGTSATMVSGGSLGEQKQRIAEVASLLFGKAFSSEQIVNETLTRSFNYSGHVPSREALARAIQTPIDEDGDLAILKDHPVAVWLENRVALSEKDGTLVRNRPLRFSEIGTLLAEDSGLKNDECLQHLESLMRWISNVNLKHERSPYSYLPFKLHQFFSQTGSVYTTLDQDDNRKITLEPGVYQADDDNKKPIYPNVFSRGSGIAFICVTKNPDTGRLDPREFQTSSDEDDSCTDGYLILDADVWDPTQDLQLLPEAWIRVTKQGALEPRKEYKARLPSRIHFDEMGNYSDSEQKRYAGWFMSAPLLFDPTSGTFFATKTKESTKLTKLGNEGRSTSTTITAFAILNRLEEAGFDRKDQKLLSFTDNRQDAALQAGHFNDFIKVIQLRAGICKALERSEHQTLTYKNLGEALFRALGLPFLEYANTSVIPPFPSARRKYDEALEKYLVHLALYDLRRGWRVVLPNLEQCALLRIDYAHLDEVATADAAWAPVPLLNELSHAERRDFIENVLEFCRLEYALFSENYLEASRIRENEKEIRENLRSPWRLDEDESIPEPNALRYDTLAFNNALNTRSMGPTSSLGKYIRQVARRTNPTLDLRGDHYRNFIIALMDMLESADYLKSRTVRNQSNEEVKVYQLRLDRIIWRLGDRETVRPDVVKQRSYKESDSRPNRFFQKIYLRDFSAMKRLEGSDHTGQLTNQQRIEREDDFRDGTISALFCSPTMELGIDIKNLSVVHMRNAPPNPANYSQRSGRAGRSGQAALVFTYCSSYSNHDRHYFKAPTDLVAGSVVPPRLDLCNQELLTSHLHALALSEKGLRELDYSIMDLVTEQAGDLPLAQTAKAALTLSTKDFDRIKTSFKRAVFDFRDDLLTNHNHWYSDQWIDQTLSKIIENLDDSLDRWRRLYKSARNILSRTTQEIESGKYALGSREYRNAKRNLDQATRQLDLLKNTVQGQANQLSEFYPYRYLAAEGFLPGYNFTRLPLRVFVPTDDTGGEYISRPRSIALREFGPQNIIYYNGQKYEIRQLMIQDAESNLVEAKVSLKSGYLLTGEQKDLELCPFSGASLSDNQNKQHLFDLIEMTETRAEKRDRISCEEEERVSKGFLIDTYFSVDDGNLDRIKWCKVKNDQDDFLNLKFIPTARLVHINRKWRARDAEGFPMGMVSGEWKSASQSTNEEVRSVKLFTSNTADALYIEPIKALALARDGVITLQYALKRAIENVFQIEPRELGVVSMGETANPNIFLYEASEGSLGILSQFASDRDVFREVIEEAVRVCRFDDESYKGPASYDDLLSYYNQRDHQILDRHLIKDALEKLRICNVELITNNTFPSYEAQYQWLLKHSDPNSSTEKGFLKYLYENGLRLPDAAQKTVEGLFVQPDFFYHPNLWVFCDGTPHDDPALKQEDEQKRQNIMNLGHELFVYYYKEPLAERIKSRPDIFRKVK